MSNVCPGCKELIAPIVECTCGRVARGSSAAAGRDREPRAALRRLADIARSHGIDPRTRAAVAFAAEAIVRGAANQCGDCKADQLQCPCYPELWLETDLGRLFSERFT